MKRTALIVIVAVCLAILAPSAMAYTWQKWSDLGSGYITNRTSVRQFGLTVVNGVAYGGYDTGGDPAQGGTGSRFYAATGTSTSVVSTQFQTATGATAYASEIDKVMYNPYDGMLYARASSRYSRSNPSPQPSNTHAAILKIDPTTLGVSRLWSPYFDWKAEANADFISGFDIDQDTGNVWFSASRNYYKYGWESYYDLSAGTINFVNFGADMGQNGRQFYDTLTLMDNGARMSNDAGENHQFINVFDSANAQLTYINILGSDGQGGPTFQIYDRAHQTMHILQVSRNSSRIINTDVYRLDPGDTFIGQGGAANVGLNYWHGRPPGAGANESNSGGSYVSGAALDPEGNLIWALAGDVGVNPYGVAGSTQHVWFKQMVDGPWGAKIAVNNDSGIDLGIPDGYTVLNLATGNFGTGNVRINGGTAFDIWAVTQNQANGQLFLYSTASVPEPSSLLALGSGLIGLAGFAIRRRR